jgi:DNA-directed RNA polymerase specialized sigma24 family protein
MSKAWIDILCKNHKEWVAIVRSFGEDRYAEDIVQEMYIRFYTYNSHEKVIIDGEINRPYVWLTLKNTYINYFKQKQKNVKVSIESIYNISYAEETKTQHIAYDKIRYQIELEINSWTEYDRRLFNIYLKNKISMRKISKGADISLSSIFNTIKNCKTRLKDICGEDYQDYLNEDYERI